jgi:hypothetical protein
LRIFHGADDDVIPPTMGRALAQRHPGWATHREIVGADHVDVIGEASIELNGLMR